MQKLSEIKQTFAGRSKEIKGAPELYPLSYVASVYRTLGRRLETLTYAPVNVIITADELATLRKDHTKLGIELQRRGVDLTS